MEVRLHANATTTPRIREYIQSSTKSVSELALELGVNESTIRRWRGRSNVLDKSHKPHNLNQSTTLEEEELITELRQMVGLSIDDITEVMHRCVNPNLSRSAIYRCLRRKGATQRPHKSGEVAPLSNTFSDTEFGYVHIDLKHLSKLERKVSYVFVAIERTTRFVYVEIVNNRDGKTIAACLERFLLSFPHKIHTILTDNGTEFTDRFGGARTGIPTGGHPFDVVCKHYKIIHKLTKPFSPQTNGMVERFNRRISEAIRSKPSIATNQGKNKFASHDERNEFIMKFSTSYNKTRLRCLYYKSPQEVLANLSKEYTQAATGAATSEFTLSISHAEVFTL